MGCVADAEMEEWSDSLNGVTVLVEFITTWGSSIIFALQVRCGTAPAREAEEAGKDSASSGVGVFLRPKLPRTSPSPCL